MSRIIEKTLVLSFSGDRVSNTAGTIRAAWDDARNRAADGSVKSQWLPRDAAFFIVQADAGITITRVLPTDGSVRELGPVNRNQVDSLLFAAPDHEQQLSWLPSGGVSPSWFGNHGSGIRVIGQNVTVAAGHPCRGNLNYAARVQSYRLDTPAVTLAAKQQWPLDVVIYYTEGS